MLVQSEPIATLQTRYEAFKLQLAHELILTSRRCYPHFFPDILVDFSSKHTSINTNSPTSPHFQTLIFPMLFPGKVDEKATQLHAIASLKVLLDATKPQNGAASTTASNHLSSTSSSKQETALAPGALADIPNGVAGSLTDSLDAVSTFAMELRRNNCFWKAFRISRLQCRGFFR